MTPTFADPSAPARPLHAVAPEDLDSFLEAQDTRTAAWLRATGFEAGSGDLRLIPDAEGGVAAAVIGRGKAAARARTRFALARAVAGLPAGAWRLEGMLAPEDRDEAALGWLLAQYRFDRYRPAKTGAALPQLVAPEGCDARRLEIIAAAEWLTRDLINTPANDMGPDALEEAFLALAARFGAATQVIRGDDLLTQNFPMIHAVGRAASGAGAAADGPALGRCGAAADAGGQGRVL
jgi:leucyl aminopeptidase